MTVPMITEAELQGQIVELAEMLGWSWAHFRPAKTAHGWRVPVSGPLGRGWPDLVLVRGDRIIFAELKRSSSNRPTPDQVFVLTLLGAAAETYVWTAADVEDIARILSRRAESTP